MTHYRPSVGGTSYTTVVVLKGSEVVVRRIEMRCVPLSDRSREVVPTSVYYLFGGQGPTRRPGDVFGDLVVYRNYKHYSVRKALAKENFPVFFIRVAAQTFRP